MFALEWCEFFWAVRKLFDKYKITYRSVDVDSTTYQENNRGGKIRDVLRTKTGWTTLPQIFIGGEFVGGAVDILEECKTGRLQQRLIKHAVAFDSHEATDPYSFLPKWLHPR
jgi:cysteine synthase A